MNTFFICVRIVCWNVKRKLLNTEQTRKLIHVFMRLFYCSWSPTHQSPYAQISGGSKATCSFFSLTISLLTLALLCTCYVLRENAPRSIQVCLCFKALKWRTYLLHGLSILFSVSVELANRSILLPCFSLMLGLSFFLKY